MLDLTKKLMADSITVSAVSYKINTDFRKWLFFQKMLANNEIGFYFDIDFLFASGRAPTNADPHELLKSLLDFLNPPQELPRPVTGGPDTKVIDYELDADLIYSAFLEVYGIDLIDVKELHWYKFKALMAGLHGTRLNEIMGYRSFDPNDQTTYKESMLQLQQTWEIPQQMTQGEKDALSDFDAKLY